MLSASMSLLHVNINRKWAEPHSDAMFLSVQMKGAREKHLKKVGVYIIYSRFSLLL